MNDQEHYFYPPPTDSEKLLLLEETIKFERLVLDRFMSQPAFTIKGKKYETIKFEDGYIFQGENTYVEACSEHSIDYSFLKSEFETNPYCLQEFWLSDIFYLCHEIRKDLNTEKITEAREKLDQVRMIYDFFHKLKKILFSSTYRNNYPKIEFKNDLLFHLCLPKLYSYCYVSNNSEKHNYKVESSLNREIKNTLIGGHCLEFLTLLIETAESKGKWPSMHSAVTQNKKVFEDNLKNNISSNKQLILDGRKTYITLFKDMQNRVKQALKSKPWLKSIKVSSEDDSTAKTVLATLDILIKEQRDCNDKIRADHFTFLKHYQYSKDTMTKWIKNAPYEIRELILDNPGDPDYPPSDYQKTRL